MPTTAVVPTFHMGDRMSKALEVSSVKVAEMALKLGVSRQTIGNYLSGRTKPKLAVLKVWADETGVPLEWLVEGHDITADQGFSVSRCTQPRQPTLWDEVDAALAA